MGKQEPSQICNVAIPVLTNAHQTHRKSDLIVFQDRQLRTVGCRDHRREKTKTLRVFNSFTTE